jgi:hypothetical protein
MKKRYSITLFASLFMAATAMAQIPNASFENWTAGAPDDWTVSNIPPDFISVMESDDAHDGAKSALLLVDNQAGFDVGGFMTAPNFMHSQDEGSLTGWYKANMAGGDLLSIACTLTDMGMAGVSAGVGTVGGTDDVWTAFTVGLIAVTQEIVAYGTISMQITNADGGVFATAGSECKVDELAFGGPVSVPVHESTSSLTLENVFPNPSSEMSMVQYILPQASQVSVKLYDVQGREVMQVLNLFQAPGQYRAEIPLNELETGVYQVVLSDGLTVQSSTLVKN